MNRSTVFHGSAKDNQIAISNGDTILSSSLDAQLHVGECRLLRKSLNAFNHEALDVMGFLGVCNLIIKQSHPVLPTQWNENLCRHKQPNDSTRSLAAYQVSV